MEVNYEGPNQWAALSSDDEEESDEEDSPSDVEEESDEEDSPLPAPTATPTTGRANTDRGAASVSTGADRGAASE